MVDDAKSDSGTLYLRLAELTKSGEEDKEDGVISTSIGNGEARANMRTRVTNLARIPRVEWDKKHFRSLDIPNCSGIYELKWKAEGKQFRAAGYDHPEGYFVMVLLFTHKGKVYNPPGWKEIIKKRREEVTSGNWKIIQFEP